MEENTDMEIHPDLEPVEPVEETLLSEEKPAAFTLVIQSWATPLVGIVMLVVGLLGGYYARPLLSSETTPVVVEGNPSTGVENEAAALPTPDATQAVQQQGLMSAVVERTRHFRGNPDAPVTIIEFSDFQ